MKTVRFFRRVRARFRIPFPTLTPAERVALIGAAALLGTGAALHAWERAGTRFGPVEDMDSLRTWVLQERAQQGDPAFPCDSAPPGLRTRASAGPAAPVNINTADASELVSLPGIGPATAKSLLEYRERHGPFRRLDQLLEVRGIGPGKLKALKALKGRVLLETPASQGRKAAPQPDSGGAAAPN